MQKGQPAHIIIAVTSSSTLPSSMSLHSRILSKIVSNGMAAAICPPQKKSKRGYEAARMRARGLQARFNVP